MDIVYFELRAANKDCQEKFSYIAKKTYKDVPIFEHACNYVNNSASYKRSGRKLEILEICDYFIKVKLTSESKLEMASKSLAGFSRELIRVDQELHTNEEDRLFRLFTYNSTLFRNTKLEETDIVVEMNYELSDVDALKRCVEIFCSSMTLTKEDAVLLETVKNNIKKCISEYDTGKRLAAYSKKVR